MMRRLLIAALVWMQMAGPAMAGISFINSASNSVSPNGTMSVAMPASCTTGDLLLGAWTVGDSPGANTDITVTGFTELADLSSTADTNDTELYVGYRYVQSGDTQGMPSTGTFTSIGGTNASNAAVVMCFRGVKTGTPTDTATSTATGENTSNADPPSHNWSGASGVWTVIVCATGHTGGATGAYTAPANYTTNFVQRNHDDTVDVLIGMGYRTNPADPEDPAVCTAANIGTAANNSWNAVTISLAEAPPAVPGGTKLQKLQKLQNFGVLDE